MPDEPEKGFGDITPRKRPGLGTYVIVFAVVALVIGGAVMITHNKSNTAPANTNPSSNPSIPITIPQLQSSIDSLNAKVDGFSGRLANLETKVAGLTAPEVTQADIDSLQASINSLTSKLATLNATIANLTGTGTGNGTSYLGEITTWTARSCYLENVPAEVNMSNITVSVGHRDRIKEEGSYELSLQIENTGNEPFNLADANAVIVLSPRDDCVIDAEATYLDCDSEPWLLWDSEVITRTREGQEVCKRIEFTSDSFKYGSGGWSTTLEANTTWNIDLVLELYYA